MKVTILGSGSAYGVPFFGGNWGNCNPQNPKNRRSTASILIEDNNTRILVDMGYDLLRQSEAYAIRELDAVIFTHSHADHIIGNFHIPIMMSYCQSGDLPLYADAVTRAGIEKMWWFQHDPKIAVHYYGHGRPVWREFKPFEPFLVGGIPITPIPQSHGGMISYGFRIGNFCYCTDLCDLSEASKALLRDLDVWVVECDTLDETQNSHSHLSKTLGWIADLKPKQAWLTHLDHTIDYDSVSARLPAGVALAYYGLVLDGLTI